MKLREFQNELKTKLIDLVFLVTPDPNLTYFAQSTFSQAILLVTSDEVRLLITRLDKPTPISGVSISYFNKGWEKELTDETIRRVGINYPSLTLGYFHKLKEIFPKAEFLDVGKILTELRIKKTEEEINKITRACRITSLVFDKLRGKLSESKFNTEQEVASFIENEIRNNDAELAFPTIVASRKNAAIPHHITSSSRLKRGFLVIDFGARYKNYCSDMTRTIYLGKPTKGEVSSYDLLLNCQSSTLNQIVRNKSFLELDVAARGVLGSHSGNFVHSLGHGIGVEVHEAPVFSNKEAKVENNHTFTIEPGIYFKNKFGIRIEDTLVFNGKPKILTSASKELLIIRK